jgi:hypothetical protein
MPGVTAPSPRRPPTARSVARAVAVAVATAALAGGCVGRRDRNDDHVGPYSFRPDDREHTMPAPAGGAAAGAQE